MSIPSWAVKGAKVVLVEVYPSQFGGDEGAAGDICVLLAVSEISGVPACRYMAEDGSYGTNVFEWARLSRFRPLVTRSQEQDIAEHFAGHLHQRVPEKA